MTPEFIKEFLLVADSQVTGAGTTESARVFKDKFEAKFRELETKISFGKGRATDVPWVGFLGYDQTIMRGIYPALLYYKEEQLLIVSYVRSSTNEPLDQWLDLDDCETISDYFSWHKDSEPKKYGQSLVFKAFNTSSRLDVKDVVDSLNQVIDTYHTRFQSYVSPNEREFEVEGIDPTVRLMDKPFNPALINIDSKSPTIDLLIKRIDQEVPEIELNTEHYFQRSDDLWDVEKQSRLIESILIRFPLPAFYFDGSDKDKWLVVDGLQRLSSLRNFVVKKTLTLTNMEFLSQLNGKTWDDLGRSLQRIIEETQVVAYIINPGTPDNVKFNIFKRINTGGLILEAQEIRHALNQGAPAEFIAELAEMQEFKSATSNSIRSKRMLDRDFVNRFLSFYLFDYRNYVPDLDTFMSNAMAHISEMSNEEKLVCKEDFRESMILNLEVFAGHAFRKVDNYSVKYRRNPLNKALFEVFSVSFAKLSNPQRNVVREKKKRILKGLIRLIEDDRLFLNSISASTGDRGRVNYRFRCIQAMIDNILNDND